MNSNPTFERLAKSTAIPTHHDTDPGILTLNTYTTLKAVSCAISELIKEMESALKRLDSTLFSKDASNAAGEEEAAMDKILAPFEQNVSQVKKLFDLYYDPPDPWNDELVRLKRVKSEIVNKGLPTFQVDGEIKTIEIKLSNSILERCSQHDA